MWDASVGGANVVTRALIVEASCLVTAQTCTGPWQLPVLYTGYYNTAEKREVGSIFD